MPARRPRTTPHRLRLPRLSTWSSFIRKTGPTITISEPTRTLPAFIRYAKGTGRIAMGYYDYNALPAYWLYAQHFGMADHFFQPIFGPSTPGALYLVAAQSGNAGNAIKGDPVPAFGPLGGNGGKRNFLPIIEYFIDQPHCRRLPTGRPTGSLHSSCTGTDSTAAIRRSPLRLHSDGSRSKHG